MTAQDFRMPPPMLVATLLCLAALGGCANAPGPALPSVALVPRVDLARFMGDWYVIANIPTYLERGAYNARDHYRLDADGTIATTYSYNADASDGPLRHYESRGYVLDGGANAVWGQQYVWPIKADYRIAYPSDDYTETVIARAKRDYVWIMARTPTLPDADLQRLITFAAAQGYDVRRIQRVPQAGVR